MANAENINKVIALIKAHPENFNMLSWFTTGVPSLAKLESGYRDEEYECGTAACLGGFTEALMNQERGGDQGDIPIAELGVYLGLTFEQTEALFFPRLSAMLRAKPAHGIHALEIVRDEGVVDWERVMAGD